MVVRRLGWVGLLGLLLVILPVAMAWSHCEIPCGIYDDRMRIQMIDEHIATIEKSMKEIVKLQEEKPINYNQLVRWVVNKEDHANQLQEIVSQYFMTQRIKTDAKDYEKKVAVLHQLLVYAMKCKQTTDLSNTQKLRELIEQFEALYFEHKH
jgi:nickel superoxide dismutase